MKLSVLRLAGEKGVKTRFSLSFSHSILQKTEKDHGLRSQIVNTLAEKNRFRMLFPSHLRNASICTLRRSAEGGAFSPALLLPSLG